jgi:hypothetical protein
MWNMFTYNAIQVQNFISHYKGWAKTEGVWEQSAEGEHLDFKQMKDGLEKNYIITSFIICNLHLLLFVWLNKSGNMGTTYSTHRRNEKCT